MSGNVRKCPVSTGGPAGQAWEQEVWALDFECIQTISFGAAGSVKREKIIKAAIVYSVFTASGSKAIFATDGARINTDK
jgi:hypothetical protein